ncbi:[protein-PII] uridylyltransferase [Pseudoalteromonas sp. MMG024]|uniref:[protein-PII] uridylyltransferase n=1 Tax=Pseudoalteromonas sp. MMG024 TaxID=2909980 RepID=UPI001EFFC32F|nr:[protein-PII] uridylyltransferase [Pseudoalteromonas sp. MMG024]MCF6457477.1 [protein-PII] uridylyltransferase [Pseudoalteromonas sp. MMG024]
MRTIYKDQLDKLTNSQNERFFSSSISSLLRERADELDKMLIDMWRECGLVNSPCSLNAVGGYGRATLHPYSDIDIAIITPDDASEFPEDKVRQFVTGLWDLGLDIGHSVRNLAEAKRFATEDITIATNLLDIRCLYGNKQHAESLLSSLYDETTLSDFDFFKAKLEEQQARHEKALNTALYLEPNIKTNPGGLRDFQTIIWVARKHLKLSNAGLFEHGELLQEDEQFELIEAHDFICRIRWALHCVANRPQELLLFEYQADVAEFLKFGRGDSAQQAIERMMRQLFRAMTRLQELNQILCENVSLCISRDSEKEVLQVNENFAIVDGLVDVNSSSVFIDKSQVIKLFGLLANHPKAKGISSNTLKLLRKVRHRLLGELQDYQSCREEFIRLFEQPKTLKKVLGLMHRYGVLEMYATQWAQTEGRMQFDIHNAYTVDEHVYKTVSYISDFANHQDDHETYHIAYGRVQNKLALSLAAFCHHLAGSQDSESHSTSAILAKEFAAFHNLKNASVELIEWLIENQELLINTSRTLDIYDPRTIRSLNKQVKSLERLNALYTLTVADIMATNEDAWNDWQAAILEQLYLASREAFKTDGQSIFEQRTVIRENKAQAQTILSNSDIALNDVTQFWSTLPNSFFTFTSAKELSEITAKVVNATQFPLVFLTQSDQIGCSTLVVYTPNRQKLFVDIFNTLTQAKVSVKDAELLETKDGNVLEVFRVLDVNDEQLSESYRIKRVISQIERVIESGHKSCKLPVAKKIKSFDSEPMVEFIPTPKRDRTLLKVTTLNNPTYVDKICSVFRNLTLSIHSAKVTTLGESLESVFLLSDSNNECLKEDLRSQVIDAFGYKLS